MSENNLKYDLLIIGGGPGGYVAAIRASQLGLNVGLVERENLGGELTNEFTTDQTANLWFQEAKGKLQKYRDEDNSRLKILTSATAYAWYDHNYIEVLQTHGTGQSMVHESGQTARKVLHKIRTKEVILATGAHERPMLFETNDLANIMLSQSVRRYINEFNVVAGKEIVLYGNNDSIYNTAIDLSKHNIKSKVVDVRASGNESEIILEAKKIGIEVFQGFAVLKAKGKSRVTGVEISQVEMQAKPPHWKSKWRITGYTKTINCD